MMHSIIDRDRTMMMIVSKVLILLVLNCIISTTISYRNKPSMYSTRPSSYLSSFAVHTHITTTASQLSNYNFIEHTSRGLIREVMYNNSNDRFLFSQETTQPLSPLLSSPPSAVHSFLVRLLRNYFLPGGSLSTDYYKYTLWRIAQRFFSSTSSVLGTQALLMALGFKANHIGIAAATRWVLKDALGKFSRIIWAGKYGRKFDSDAKKWRFRSSLLFATGNALEIVTYFKPANFLIIAAIANAMKQMAMLTSSATRNTIYKSFARNNDNIGDITAKGEAQIAVVDLMGMLMGIIVSKIIGTSRFNIATTFILFSTIDVYCIFNEIQSVVFHALNYDRTAIVLNRLFHSFDNENSTTASTSNTAASSIITSSKTVDISSIDKYSSSYDSSSSSSNVSKAYASKPTLPDPLTFKPAEAAALEQLFLPTKFGEEIFQLWSTIHIRPSTLLKYINIFDTNTTTATTTTTTTTTTTSSSTPSGSNRIIVTFSIDKVSSHMHAIAIKTGYNSASFIRKVNGTPLVFTPSVLLHKDATAMDVFKSLVVVHRIMYQCELKVANINSRCSSISTSSTSCSSDVDLKSIGFDEDSLVQMTKEAYAYTCDNMSKILSSLSIAGWDVHKFMYGNIRRRVEW